MSWWLLLAMWQAPDPCRLGSEALGRRDLASAEVALRECVGRRPAGIEPLLMLCGVYQLQGNREALFRASLDGIKRFPGDARFYLTAGSYAGREKRFSDAVRILEAAHKRWPGDPKFTPLLASAHLGRGMELLDASGHEEAAAHLRRSVELKPDDAEAQLNLGRALHNLHRGREALDAFDRVLALDGGFPLARFHRGMTLHSLGDAEPAVAALTAELADNPDYAPAWLIRGLAWMALGDWGKALPDLETAAARMPAAANAHYARARCLLRLGSAEEAESGLRKAIELDASDPAPMHALARLLSQSGRGGEAAELRSRAAALASKQRSAEPGEIQFQSFRRPRAGQ